MRVALLHSRYLSGPVSGENRVVEDQARLLREAGHEVVVYAPSAEEVSMVQAGIGTIWSRRAANAVRRLVAEARPDVVHVHNLFPMLSPAVLRVSDDVPVVMTLHNFRYMCLSGTLFRDGRICEDCVGRVPWPGIVHGCYRDSKAASATLATSITVHRGLDSWAGVDTFVALSDFMRRKHEHAGVPADRMIVQTNFSWPTERRQGPGGYFLYLGRLAPEKGLGSFVRAWEQVPVPLLIVGEGPEEENLRAQASGQVEFRGSVPASEVPDLLRGARALVVPSTWYEGAPRAIIEAYAAGVPVLASEIGALPEIVVEGETGYLVPPSDASGWIEVARRLADDEVAVRMGEAAYRRWVEVHDPSQGLAGLETLYRVAAETRRERTRP